MSPARATYIPAKGSDSNLTREQDIPPVWGHRPPVFIGYGNTAVQTSAPSDIVRLTKYAIFLGILSLVFCWMPFAGIASGVVGFAAGKATTKRLDYKGESSLLASIGKWSSLIGAIISVVFLWQTF